MIQYERINISKGINFSKIKSKSLECMTCYYWYFKNIGFEYQPYVCNACHDFVMIVQSLGDFAILKVNKVGTKKVGKNLKN